MLLTQLLARDLPEGAYLVALQLKVVALLPLPIHLGLEAQRERLQLIARHGGRVHAIDEHCKEANESFKLANDYYEQI